MKKSIKFKSLLALGLLGAVTIAIVPAIAVSCSDSDDSSGAPGGTDGWALNPSIVIVQAN